MSPSETATSSLQELLLIKGGGFLFFNFNVASENLLSYYIGFLLENNSETFFSFGEGGRRRRGAGGVGGHLIFRALIFLQSSSHLDVEKNNKPGCKSRGGNASGRQSPDRRSSRRPCESMSQTERALTSQRARCWELRDVIKCRPL